MKLLITGQKFLNNIDQVDSAIKATACQPTLILLVAQNGGFGTGLIKNWAHRNNVVVKITQAKTSVHGRLADRIRINHAVTMADKILVIGEPTSTGKRVISTAKYFKKIVTHFNRDQEEVYGINNISGVVSAA
jgi:hypothetical protein